jgi:glyoxylate/hydroxypyruvate reductase
MQPTLHVLVYVRESSERYRRRLTDSREIQYTFCESEAEVAQSIGTADIILGSITFPVTYLMDAHRLRWIQATAAGVDRFLSEAQIPAPVRLTRADVRFGDQIAEYVLCHLLAHTQRLREVFHLQREHLWKPLTVDFLRGKTVGIAGTGSIGMEVAARMRAMGMCTLGLATQARPVPAFDRVFGADELGSFLCPLDILVLCLPLTDRTRGFLGHEELALLKESAILVNVARGALIDELSLVEALENRRIRAAILDVFEQEPLPKDSPLWSMENVTVTSHHAGLNVPDAVIDFFLENLQRYRSGIPLRGEVDLARGY